MSKDDSNYMIEAQHNMQRWGGQFIYEASINLGITPEKPCGKERGGR